MEGHADLGQSYFRNAQNHLPKCPNFTCAHIINCVHKPVYEDIKLKGCLYLTGIKLEKATWSSAAEHCTTMDQKQSESR
jgi:hypothetical protein